jgi:hypothetical protein
VAGIGRTERHENRSTEVTDKTLPPGHVSTLTPEQIAEAMRKIARGSKDGGLTLPKAKPIDPNFDARTATQEEIDKHARANGISIKRY